MANRFCLVILAGVVLLSSGPAGADGKKGVAARIQAQVLGPASRLVNEGEVCAAHALLVRPTIKGLSPRHRRTLKRKAKRVLREADLTRRECQVYNKVTRLQALARGGKPARATLRLATTIGWGCPCAPLVFDRIHGSGLSEVFLYPVMKAGVPDITLATSFRGRLRVRGSFTGKEVDRYQWAKLRGARTPPRTGDRAKHYRKRHPLFRVSWWCFTPGRALSAAEGRELRKELRQAIPKNRFCGGKRP